MRVIMIGLVLVGCGESARRDRGSVEAETHWMRTCVADDECGALSCVCGFCTEVCAPEACGLGECVPGEWAGAVCGEARVCSEGCVEDADCTGYDPGLACIDGYCGPAPAGDAGVSDAAPDGGPGDAAPDAEFDLGEPDATDLGPDAAPDAGEPDAGDPCEEVFCDECYVCEAGECVVDQAQLALDEPICGSLCMDWPNRCAAITVAHQPLRPGPCFDQAERALCESTQGEWFTGGCESAGCGMRDEGCLEQCGFACDCGPNATWDAARGCVGGPTCEPGSCDAEAICAGAWRAGEACLDPTGAPLDAACCADLECGIAGNYHDPRTGACVAAELSCGVPTNAPPCAPEDPPCDVGLFLRYPWPGTRAGACFGPGGERTVNRLFVRPELRVYGEAALELEVPDNCPSGAVSITGLPPGYDAYGTCQDGACDIERPATETIQVDGQRQLRSVLGDDARICNDPLPADTYTLGATLPVLSDHVVCDFSFLELRILAE